MYPTTRGRSNACLSKQTSPPFDPASRRFNPAQGGGAAITVERHWRANGLEGEIEKAIRRIADGKLESDVTRHEEARQTLAWKDQIRREVRVRYPFAGVAKP